MCAYIYVRNIPPFSQDEPDTPEKIERGSCESMSFLKVRPLRKVLKLLELESMHTDVNRVISS